MPRYCHKSEKMLMFNPILFTIIILQLLAVYKFHELIRKHKLAPNFKFLTWMPVIIWKRVCISKSYSKLLVKKKMFFLKILLQGTGKNWKPLSLCITPVYALWTTAHNTVTACTGGYKKKGSGSTTWTPALHTCLLERRQETSGTGRR